MKACSVFHFSVQAAGRAESFTREGKVTFQNNYKHSDGRRKRREREQTSADIV